MRTCQTCREAITLTESGWRHDDAGQLHVARPWFNANPVLEAMRTDYGDDDEWGTTMAWGFALCEVLHYRTDVDVPDELDFHPSPVMDDVDREQYPDGEVLRMLEDGEVTEDDLFTAARCVGRYSTWLKMAGKDY